MNRHMRYQNFTIGCLLFLAVGCDIVSGSVSSRLTASGKSPGFRVATDGPTVVVGAFRGAAAIYERSGGGGWRKAADLAPNEADALQEVAVSGDVAVVSAYAIFDPSEQYRGAVYVYERQGSTWTQTARLVPTDLVEPRLFGRALAVAGDQILVAVDRRRGTGSAGDRLPNVVQVFGRSGSGWTLVQTILPPNPERNVDFGVDIAVDGDVAVLGTAERDADGQAGSSSIPSVVVLRRQGTQWTAETVFREPDALLGAVTVNGFGRQVATDGRRIAVSASSATVGGREAVGVVFVYDFVGGAWTQTSRIDNPEPLGDDFFGYGLGVEGSTVVVGSEFKDRGRGAVFTFENSGGGWMLVDRLSEDLAPSATFGTTLALDGGTLIVGAPYDRGGAAYAYRRSAPGWTSE